MIDNFQGIVLFTRPHREQDGLVKIFTREFGTKMFFIRGLQKANHSLKKHLIPLTSHFYTGTINQQGLSFIREAQSIDIYRRLQTDPFLQAHAAYLAQLVDAAIEDNLADAQLFDFFQQLIEKLNQAEDGWPIHLLAQVQLLARFGVMIDWQHCQVCGSDQGKLDFSFVKQGLICHRHWKEDPKRMHLPTKVVTLVQIFSQIRLDQLGKIDLSDQTCLDVNNFLLEIYQEWVGIHLKAATYLKQLYASLRQME